MNENDSLLEIEINAHSRDVELSHQANFEFDSLMRKVRRIASIETFYLWYDVTPGQEGKFDRAFYAHGEIIKLCQHITEIVDRLEVSIKNTPM